MTPELLPREETEAALEEILASPPFGQEDWAQALVERFRDWYANVGELHVSDPVLFWAAIIVPSLVLAFLLWHVSVSLSAVWRAMRGEGISAVALAEIGRGRDLDPARAALSRGENRRAVELAWSAVVTTARDTTARTPRQQARRLAEELASSLRPHLHELLRMHEHACYAGVETSASLARAAIERAALLTEADSG